MSWHPGGPVGNPHLGPGFAGRNRQTTNGGPSSVSRSHAREDESLFSTYEHLQGLQRADAALTMLRKVASQVKPIMRKHGWRVQVLAEFLPPEQNLLGLNINKGYKICIRLRYHSNPDLLLPLEDVVDTMLHELSHNVWGDHDSNFHKLWDELRDEHEALIRKGYTGEGFLGQGQKLGGTGFGRPPPLHEMRQRARASAEKRNNQGILFQGSGQKLGGTPLHAYGGDVRGVIASQVTRRNNMNRGGCGSTRQDAIQIADEASRNTFKTKAEEDDANNRAIAQALYELMEQEEAEKLKGTSSKNASATGSGLAWSAENGLYDAGMSMPETKRQPTEEEQLKWAMQDSMRTVIPETAEAKPTGQATQLDPASSITNEQWACEICTCINPLQYLACEACGVERSQRVIKKIKPEPASTRGNLTKKPVRTAIPPAPPVAKNQSLGWKCQCGTFMEHKWWTCSVCGRMKTSS